jgi:hypothetical protein
LAFYAICCRAGPASQLVFFHFHVRTPFCAAAAVSPPGVFFFCC